VSSEAGSAYQLHVGYHKGWLGNIGGYYAGAPQLYEDRDAHGEGLLYLRGVWIAYPDSILHGRPTQSYDDYVILKVMARGLSVETGPARGEPVRVRVLLDGKPVPSSARGQDLSLAEDGQSYLQVDSPRAYHLFLLAGSGVHEVALSSNSSSFSLSAFTVLP